LGKRGRTAKPSNCRASAPRARIVAAAVAGGKIGVLHSAAEDSGSYN